MKLKHKQRKILILSPHLDDAVFSCFDFIHAQTCEVQVITVFTQFQEMHLPVHILEYLQASGFSSVAAFQKARLQEDVHAMKLLGCKWRHLDYIDGGFRVEKNVPYYPTTQDLFSGQFHPKDYGVIDKLSNFITQFKDAYDLVVTPYGVGKHVDHLIVRKTSEESVEQKKLLYYLDFPYVQSLRNWECRLFRDVFTTRHFFFPTQAKRSALNVYHSQSKFLFSQGVFFPEVILKK